MKKFKLPLSIFLVLMLFLTPLMGLAETTDDTGTDGAEIGTEAPEDADEATDEPTDDSAEEEADEPTEEDEIAEDDSADAAPAYSPSAGIGEDGRWAGVTALDHVELFDYKAISIPSDTHTITDEAVQEQVDSILASYTIDEQVTDRAVEDGDTVNIDYVGSVDGEEFSGGSTGGAGADVTIGVTSYIDDFLEQLIGHMPGETFNVEVTFPEDYGVDELNGKDAVFVTTINYISVSVEPTLSDDFVAENMAADYEWTTIEEMKQGIYQDLQEDAIWTYVQARMVEDAKVGDVPEQMLQYQEDALINYYEEYASMFGMDMEGFLTTYMGVASVEELIETYRESNKEAAIYYLVTQAIAEDSGIVVTDEDVAQYFFENVGTDDYSDYEEQYGMPYLKQVVLCAVVVDNLMEGAVLE